MSRRALNSSYKIGFARPAMIEETVKVAGIYDENQDWHATKDFVIDSNFLQARTLRTQGIVFSEIQSRLSRLNEQQISIVACGTRNDVKALIWITLCKQYLFIKDFTIEILAELYGRGAQCVTHDDYAVFFNAKAEWHPEIDRISDKTKANARQTLFLMMRQCGIIADNKELLPMLLSGPLRMCTDPDDLVLLPGAI